MLSEFERIFETHDAHDYNIKDLDNDMNEYFNQYLLEIKTKNNNYSVDNIMYFLKTKLDVLVGSFYRGGCSFNGRYSSTGLLCHYEIIAEDNNIVLKYVAPGSLYYNQVKIQYR